jgi:TATA-box binding protein (TBP) (component of TFIID and TFIIIB)
LHPGVTYKLLNPKATLKIFSTGSVTVTGNFDYYSSCSITIVVWC